MFGESAVSHQESQLAERDLVDHLGRWWWAMVGIPHISPGGVYMGPVWYGQSKKCPAIPPSGFVIELITFCRSSYPP